MAKLLGQERSGHRIDRYWLHVGDDGREKITVETVEDVEPILDTNRKELNDFDRKNDHPIFGRKVASIPGVVLMEVCRIHKISFRELMLSKTDRSKDLWNKLLNNPDLSKFRTAPGRVDLRRTA